MAEPIVVGALRRKYAELAGEIEACHKRLKELHANLSRSGIATAVRSQRRNKYDGVRSE